MGVAFWRLEILSLSLELPHILPAMHLRERKCAAFKSVAGAV
jgi:hypothetical protein